MRNDVVAITEVVKTLIGKHELVGEDANHSHDEITSADATIETGIDAAVEVPDAVDEVGRKLTAGEPEKLQGGAENIKPNNEAGVAPAPQVTDKQQVAGPDPAKKLPVPAEMGTEPPAKNAPTPQNAPKSADKPAEPGTAEPNKFDKFKFKKKSEADDPGPGEAKEEVPAGAVEEEIEGEEKSEADEVDPLTATITEIVKAGTSDSFLAKAGTSEGAKLGWQSRQRGMAPDKGGGESGAPPQTHDADGNILKPTAADKAVQRPFLAGSFNWSNAPKQYNKLREHLKALDAKGIDTAEARQALADIAAELKQMPRANKYRASAGNFRPQLLEADMHAVLDKLHTTRLHKSAAAEDIMTEVLKAGTGDGR